MQGDDREKLPPFPTNHMRQKMDDRNGGLVMASRSIQHPAPRVEHAQKMSASSRASTLAQVTYTSEDDRLGVGEEREIDRGPVAQSAAQGTPTNERTKRNSPELGHDVQQTGESNIGENEDGSSTRAQHESFGDDEQCTVHDSVLAQHRKALILVRLQETYPKGRLTMVRLFVTGIASPKPIANKSLDRSISLGGVW